MQKLSVFRIATAALIAIVVASFYFFKKDPCFVEQPSKDDTLISMKVGSKKVHLIGWYHGTVEWDMAEIAFSDAFAEAQKGNCKQAQEMIREILPKLKTKEDESLRVLSLLETIYRQKPFNILGLEHTPSQYQSMHWKNDLDMSLRYLTKLKEFCPGEISTFKRMYLLFPGPEYEFAGNKTDIQIIPMGDDILVEKSFDALSDESRNFQLRVTKMSAESIKVYEQFVARSQSQPIPDTTELDLMTSSLKDPEKSELKKYFGEVATVLKIFPERDVRFAKEILKQSSDNVVLVVGSRHLTGIKNQLQHICK